MKPTNIKEILDYNEAYWDYKSSLRTAKQKEEIQEKFSIKILGVDIDLHPSVVVQALEKRIKDYETWAAQHGIIFEQVDLDGR